MNDDSQREVIAFLSTPGAYARPQAAPGLSRATDEIERIDTHISIVWLVGNRAFKLKRAVRFDYVDFSTIELRRLACEAELHLNRRTAPSLYLGVRAVTREADGRLALEGKGEPVDWLVEMARFDQETLFDRLARRQRLELTLMDGLAAAIARLHSDAERRTDRGGRSGMAWVIDGNAAGFAEQGRTVLDQAACARLTADSHAVLARSAERLDARRRGGFVRACHGDLHLRNICLVDGVPTLFDAVEFNENISCIDVFYDLAFLLMDLWNRDLRLHANAVLNGYVALTADVDGLALLPLFLACRAAVRAKTSATAARVQPDERQRVELAATSRQYLALAQALLRPGQPRLVAVGGLSGTGKSTLARRLAPEVGAAPGALVARSDVIRKTLLGAPPLTRLGPGAYTADVSDRVYTTLAEQCTAALSAGHSAIADAVFARERDRETIRMVARQAGVPFLGIWMDASHDVLARRLEERRGDASDATVDVLAMQERTDVGRLDWERLDASQSLEAIHLTAARLLEIA
jgi:aminoglycoside phosphotransferase family enzyme/predicted kinase